MSEKGTVYVVDDDPSVRRTAARLFEGEGFAVEVFSTAREFLDYSRPHTPACLVLDVRMPGLGGFDLQQELERSASDLPIVFMTGHGDIPLAVRAMKAGAVDFLPKPVDPQKLLEVVRQGIDEHRKARSEHGKLAAAREAVGRLTRREKEVMTLVVAGLLNKQIAYRLGISLSTVKAHRRNVMEKTACESVADLVRLAGQVDPSTPGRREPSQDADSD